MCTLSFVSKENPVYLYRIVRSTDKNAPSISFAMRLMVDKDFGGRLCVSEKDGTYE